MKINKKNKRLICVFFTAILVNGCIFAAKNGNAGEIALPGISTVVGGDSEEAGKEVLPDFEEIASAPEKNSEITPELPVNEKDNTGVFEKIGTDIEKKAVFAEGKIGGGYPLLLNGDFTVYRLSGADPFELRFSHDSADGYCRKNFISGYSDRDSRISVNKQFNNQIINLETGADFETTGNGFQDLVPYTTDLNQNFIKGFGKFSLNFKNHLYTGTNLDVDYYNRYINFASSNNTAVASADWVARESIFSMSPVLYGGWKNNGLDIKLSGQYWLDWDTEGSVSSDKNPYGINNGRANNRADFNFSLFWENDIVRFYGDASLVVGTQLNGHDVLAPFKMGIKGNFPVYYANRKVGFHLEGGLDSWRNSISEKEKIYKYSGFSFIPQESSDWYGVMDFSLPLGTFFEATALAEYRRTAFNNGIWSPVYENSYYCNGIYGYKVEERSALKTDLRLTLYINKIVTLSAGWHANWLKVPVLENRHSIYAEVTVQKSDSSMGIIARGQMSIDAVDKTPDIEIEAFAKITPSVQIVLNCDDLLKLCGNEVRIYAGHYIERSGSASMALKFFF